MLLFIGCPCMHHFCSFCNFMAFFKGSFSCGNQYAFAYTAFARIIYFRGFTTHCPPLFIEFVDIGFFLKINNDNHIFNIVIF